LGEEAMWEAYQLRKKFYDNSATHVEVLKCLLPLVRAYNRQGEKHEQVINLLEPVVAELQSQSTDADADADADARRTAEDKSEWLAKCLNLLAEAREQAAQFEQAEKHRLKALHILKRTRGPHDYETVQALRGLAAGFVQRELYPEAEKCAHTILLWLPFHVC
jgi:ABC-type transporter Mla subunit MlaD